MRTPTIPILLCTMLALTACSEQKPPTTAIYMLLDTSGTYTEELNKAQRITNSLLATLNSGGSLAIARIDSGSFSEKDIIAKVTFDEKPSTMTSQKHVFKRKIDAFVASVKGSAHTDISGAVLQASEYLKETGATHRYILIFSDLEEDLAKNHIRNFTIPLTDVNVVALNVTKLRQDNIDPREYIQRLDQWEQRVSDGGGTWKVVNDLEHLERML